MKIKQSFRIDFDIEVDNYKVQRQAVIRRVNKIKWRLRNGIQDAIRKVGCDPPALTGINIKVKGCGVKTKDRKRDKNGRYLPMNL